MGETWQELIQPGETVDWEEFVKRANEAGIYLPLVGLQLFNKAIFDFEVTPKQPGGKTILKVRRAGGKR